MRISDRLCRNAALISAIIVLADALKHLTEILEPGPWRSGFPFLFLALGLTLSAIATSFLSYRIWHSRNEPT
jgi:hypothetical protein